MLALEQQVVALDSVKWLPKSPRLYGGHTWGSQGSRWASLKGKEGFHGGHLFKLSSANGKWREGRISPEQEAEELDDPDEDEPVSKFSGSLFDTDENRRDQRNIRAALQEKHKAAMRGKTFPRMNSRMQPPVPAAAETNRFPEDTRAAEVAQPPLKGILIARLPRDGPADLAGVQAGDRGVEGSLISEPNIPDAGPAEASPKSSSFPTAHHAITISSHESGTKPLTFTFVPSIGQLPTHFEVVDVSKFLVRLPEDPKDLSCQETTYKSNTASDEPALKSGARQDSAHRILQAPSCNSNKAEMQENDLFKAEFILITDSGEEDEASAASHSTQQAPNGYGPISARLLAPSHVSAGGEARIAPGDLHGSSASHSSAQHPKQQLVSTLSTSDHLSSKTPALHLISPTNPKVACGDMVNLNQASALEDSRKSWQSPTGSSKQDSSLYFQSTFRSPPPSMSNISSSASNSCYSSSWLYDYLQTPSLPTSACIYETRESTKSSVPVKSPSPSSGLPHSAEIQASPAKPLSPRSSKRLKALSPIPVHIITHSLSPSPKPLSPPSLYGSSSTIASVSESYTQMSSRGNPVKSGVKPPLPTRLTLLTAILRSGSSQQRPLSPASCPTFSPGSLGSSTLAIDQKFRTTPPTPKKYVSSPSIGPVSPSREESWLSGFAHHVSLSSQPHATSQARSPSPKKHLSHKTPSPDSLSPLSSPIVSHRKSAASPHLQPVLSASALPPRVPTHLSPSPPEEMLYPLSTSQGPQRSQRVHTYSPVFTCQSYPLLVSPSQRGVISPTPEKHSSPSPSLSPSTSRSKSNSSHRSNQELSASSPTPLNISKQSSPSWPDTASPLPQNYSIYSQPLQLNSSSRRTNYRSNSYSPRPEQSVTSPVTKCRSPVSDKSPCTLLSRPRELTSPQSFSLPPDHENIKPQQYKIKTSYKAFAAIPTNTLLMEQKALDEPAKTAETEGITLDTHSEMCSPAQLRQQTEELCAVIDQVLQDPLTMRRCESSPSFLQTTMESDVGKMSTTLQRAAGRETRYASLYKSAPMVTESQMTKPGVIRPVLVKALKKEEPYQPNPFKKYLEEISDQDTEQETAVLHPLYPTKPLPPTKPPLHPASCLTPGPFSRFPCVLRDAQGTSYSPYSHNTLYNKPSHPIVPIPENETLSSEEVIH
ncbi:muscular LMNA-interacting protein [Eudromia elegans]